MNNLGADGDTMTLMDINLSSKTTKVKCDKCATNPQHNGDHYNKSLRLSWA